MKVLVLAGGYAQGELIKNLKNRGYEVILADYNEEPIAKAYADGFYKISTLDLIAVEKLAKDENVNYIMTVCTDQALHTIAHVSKKLGLPCYIDYETALNVTNKQFMKKIFYENNIPTSKYTILDSYDETSISKLKFPLIVKPVDCNSSKGVKKVIDNNQLKSALNEAVFYSRTNTAIIEEYISGSEISVDAYVEDGIAKILSISNSDKIKSDDKFVILRGNYPAKCSTKAAKEIQKIVQNIANAFSLKNTPLLVQMINSNETLYVLEFSARSGGGVKHIMVKNASGFDVIDAVIELSIGNKPHIIKIEPEYKYLTNVFIYCHPGIFDHFEGFDELKTSKIIDDYYLFKSKFTKLSEATNSGDRIGGFTIKGNRKKDIIIKYNTIIKNIKVIDIYGKDIMWHELLYDIN